MKILNICLLNGDDASRGTCHENALSIQLVEEQCSKEKEWDVVQIFTSNKRWILT